MSSRRTELAVAALGRTSLVAALLVFLASFAQPAAAVEFPGPAPGMAGCGWKAGEAVLQNAVIQATWKTSEDRLTLVAYTDRLSGAMLRPVDGDVFRLVMDDGRLVRSSQLKLKVPLQHTPILDRPDAVRLADRFCGYRLAATFLVPEEGLEIRWQAELRNEGNAVRQELTVQAGAKDAAVREIVLVDVIAPGARVEGTVDGSPIVAGNLFLGCEHPMSIGRVEGDRAVASVGTFGPIRAGTSCKRASVVGSVTAGQLRRGFLYYLERERPRPYQPLLHYNSWYDIAWVDRKMDEAKCLDVIETLGRELVKRRKVRLDSLVFDDGWDDNRTLWLFHSGFPQGFTPLTEAAARYHSSIGVWLSPWGGYAQAKKERLQYGQEQGFEMNRRGFSLAGPKYYSRFRDVCAEMVRKYGVNSFKFDGIAAGDSQKGSGAEYAGDVDALIRLLADLRAIRPDLFINVTTGTWPSPFWLITADSIWRNANDMGFFGPGSKRQQWITYRDMIVYQRIVRRAPLYPISSLMTQGIAHARLGNASQMGDDLAELTDEIRSFFGSGTQLQELYITPSMFTPAMWDRLAEGANWSRRHAQTLSDVHWVGGDPQQGQVYGFAAWSPREALLTLRNPRPEPASFALDVGTAMELPASAAKAYRFQPAWSGPSPRPPMVATAGRAETITLAPFEVLVLEGTPVR